MQKVRGHAKEEQQQQEEEGNHSASVRYGGLDRVVQDGQFRLTLIFCPSARCRLVPTGGCASFPSFFRLHVSGKSALAGPQRWSGSQSRERDETATSSNPTPPTLPVILSSPSSSCTRLTSSFLATSTSAHPSAHRSPKSAAKTITLGANIVPRTRTANNRHPSTTPRQRTSHNLISIVSSHRAAHPASFHTRGYICTPSWAHGP